MQTQIDAKIVDRIRKLLALAADGGATEAEAESATARAQEMMVKYNLSIVHVEASGGSAEGGQRTKDGMSKNVLFEYQRHLMSIVAQVNFTYCAVDSRWVYDKAGRGKYRPMGYELIGRQANVVAVKTTFEYLNQTINRVVRAWVNGDHTRLMSNEALSFKKGMSDRLQSRLWHRYWDLKAKQSQEATNAQKGSTANALVIRLEDIEQNERDLNWDMALGREPGTTARQRAEAELRRAAEREVEKEREPEVETEKQKAQRERREKRYRQRQEREANKVNWVAYDQGSRAADTVSLEQQLDTDNDKRRIN